MKAFEINCSPSFEAFEQDYNNGKPALLWTKRIDDIETPITALAKLGVEKFGSSLFESVEGGENKGRYSIVTANPDYIFQVDRSGIKEADIDENGNIGTFRNINGNPLDAIKKILKDNKINFPPHLPPPLAGLYGYLGYEMVRYFEKLPQNEKDPLNLPEAVLTRPRIVIVFDGIKQELILATPIYVKNGVDAKTAYEKAKNIIRGTWEILDKPCPLKAPSPKDISNYEQKIKPCQTPEQYIEGVKKAKEYIKAGDIFQVVPSQRFEVDFEKSPLALYRALRRTNPSPFMFILQMQGFSIIGSSPEILVRLRDGTVTIRPIAGTRPRGETQAKDIALEEELLNDPKELAEHLMLLDLGRNDVGRVSISKPNTNQEHTGTNMLNKGGVKVTQKFVVERYSHVMHIVSNVEGTLKPNLDAIDALLAGFPAGTVSGAPKIRAMEIIAEIEPHERGVYAGGVGYFSANGDMDMCIALRTGVLKDNKLYIQAGAGVVLDSDPLKEHLECVAKSKALVTAAVNAQIYE